MKLIIGTKTTQQPDPRGPCAQMPMLLPEPTLKPNSNNISTGFFVRIHTAGMVASFSPDQQPPFSWNKIFCVVTNRKRLVLRQSQTDPPVLCYYGKTPIFIFIFISNEQLLLSLSSSNSVDFWVTFLGPVRFSICWSRLRLWYRNHRLITTPKMPNMNASWRIWVCAFVWINSKRFFLIHRLHLSHLFFNVE